MADLPFVVVAWADAWVVEASVVTLADVANSHGTTEVHTAGWLLRDDEKGISLANERFENSFRGRTFIPRQLIQSVTVFNLVKSRKRKKKEPGPCDVFSPVSSPS